LATGALATETTTHGELALVLHAHLPYVHSSEPGSLEEDWYFQALLECYLPLLDVLETAAADPAQHPRLSMGLSPTLLSLLSSRTLSERFGPWLAVRQELLLQAPAGFEAAAADLAQQLSSASAAWHRCNGNLLPRFQRLQQAGVLDLLTCAATHGYLPLLRDSPEAVRAQLLTAVREHQRLLGVRPQGIWLPECAYYEGLDRLLVSCGLRYAILDAHGLLHGQPRPRYGCMPPSAPQRGWPSSGVIANPPCRCGAPVMATPAMPATGNSTAIWAGISPRANSNSAALAAAGRLV
jgi:1,4-alpha-glucan branching enzyme